MSKDKLKKEVKKIILFIRQSPFLPENENLEIVTGKIHRLILEGKIEELKQFDVNWSIPTTWKEHAKERITALRKELE